MATVSIIESRPVLYINVVLEDASEAIKAGVTQKLDNVILPNQLKRRLAKGVCRIVADRFSASKIVAKMIPQMLQEIPIKMKKKGLTVHAEEVFRDGPYFVLMIQVQHVDAALLIEAKKLAKKQKGAEPPDDSCTVYCIKWLLQMAGVTLADTVQADYLPILIQSKLQPSLGVKFQQELADKKMEASVDVVLESKQSRFFYTLLQQVREAEAAKKKSHGRIILSKRSSSTTSTSTSPYSKHT